MGIKLNFPMELNKEWILVKLFLLPDYTCYNHHALSSYIWATITLSQWQQSAVIITVFYSGNEDSIENVRVGKMKMKIEIENVLVGSNLAIRDFINVGDAYVGC